MFLRQGNEAGAVGGEVFLHEAELDVLEVAFGEQAPGEAVDEFVHHDEHQDQHGKEEGPLRDRGEGCQGVLPCEEQQSDGHDGDGDQQYDQVRFDDPDGQVGSFVALLEVSLAGRFKSGQASLFFLAQFSVFFLLHGVGG